MNDHGAGRLLLALAAAEIWFFAHDCDGELLLVRDREGFAITRERLDAMYDNVSLWVESNQDEIALFNAERRQMREERPTVTCKPTKRVPRAGWVYVLYGNGLYKIGMSTKPALDRVIEFAPKLPFETEIICTIKSDDPIALEKQLHERYAAKRVRGEWFKLSQADIETLKAAA